MSDRNRAIDALIAEKVMGPDTPLDWHVLAANGQTVRIVLTEAWAKTFKAESDIDEEWTIESRPRPYSTDPYASKQLRDEMREEGWLYIVMANIDDFAASAFRPSESIDVAAGETPEIRHKVEETAVALVALAALGIEAPK